MAKLQLKYLAPYLPYGLKIMRYEVNQVIQMLGLTQNGIDELIITGNYGNTYRQSFEVLKPILRPLSDLNKVISIESEPAFIPTSRYDLKMHEGEWCDIIYAEYGESPKAYQPISTYNFWLFQYHFDVFGLIDKGLAIDINTINR